MNTPHHQRGRRTQEGQRLWKLGTGCGSAFSMQYFNERACIVTTEGFLTCIDVSEAAIQAAHNGTLPQTVQVKAPPVVATPAPTTLENVTNAGTGVILECYREGARLRMRVVTPGHDSNQSVQFPQNIREEGTRYIVDEVRPAARGSFYRTYGNIRRLVEE